MLVALGVRRFALLSNNPDKAEQLDRLGLTPTEQVETGVFLCATNAGYLAAKARRLAPRPRSPWPALDLSNHAAGRAITR
jgi:GTP cyclohydrolase II